MLFGVVKQVIGDVDLRDKNGFGRKLEENDIVNFGENVICKNGSVTIDFNGVNIIIDNQDSLKIDQSVVCSESFDECVLDFSSMQEALKIIENFYNIDEMLFADELKTFDSYDLDINDYSAEFAKFENKKHDLILGDNVDFNSMQPTSNQVISTNLNPKTTNVGNIFENSEIPKEENKTTKISTNNIATFDTYISSGICIKIQDDTTTDFS